MPTFICLLNWTDQGAKTARDAGKRYQASRALAEKLGGKLLGSYITSGQYDVIATLDMPDGQTMVRFAVALSASGNARTTTVQAYPPEEFAKMAAEAPSM